MNYNIPVKIWVMDTHPNNAPICYVNPTSDMIVKPSRTVDHSGKIYLPFLHFWDPVSFSISHSKSFCFFNITQKMNYEIISLLFSEAQIYFSL